MMSSDASAGSGPAAGGALVLHADGGRWRVAVGPGAEVAACPAVTAIPGAPRWLVGMIVHKGAALALVDPAVLLPDAAPDALARARRQVLVSRLPGLALGFAADDVDAGAGADDVPALDLDALVARALAQCAESAP